MWPPRLVSESSAWNEHIPFAGWIIEATNPRVFVELGTHTGVSYFAFCEAVARLELGTECFAVDTWVGDEHSGLYGEDVYSAVAAMNTRFYESFSTLLRNTFDDAVRDFADGSIDLLHLDGLHTYEAVRHDFDTWLPKLSDRGVMLLHDTNERKRDFGVHIVMSELAERYPTFEFAHGHGLGIVGVGPNPPEPVAELTRLQSKADIVAVRELYAALGLRFALESELDVARRKLDAERREVEQLRHQSDSAKAEHARLRERADALESRAEQLRAEIRTLGDRNAARLGNLQELIENLEGDREELRRRTKSLEHELEQTLEARLSAEVATAHAFEERLAEAQNQLAAAERELSNLANRKSVRSALLLAKPARPVFRVVRSLRNRESPQAPEQPAAPQLDLSLVRSVGETQVDSTDGPHPFIASHQLARLATATPPTIVIPVYNAPEELRRCLAAAVRNTTTPARIMIIDDASTDPAIDAIIEDYAGQPAITVLRNADNLGFVRTVNRGFTESTGDVVVLNSDAEVTPRWLENMLLAAYRNPRVGTVTALSNNAGAFSAPAIGIENEYPRLVSKEDVARAVTRAGELIYPRAPTGNGFCFLVKREVLETVGLFDEESFPRGYGEENDFCMRALKAGWLNVVDDSTFVFHARGASFKEERTELMQVGRRKMDELHPDYGERVREFLEAADMERARANVQMAFNGLENRSSPLRTRVLFVIHEGTGGTPQTNIDLMSHLQPDYETFLLTSDSATLKFSSFDGSEFFELERVDLEPPVRVVEDSRREIREFVAQVLSRYAIELVHVRHLIRQTFDVPHVAGSLGIPVVMSFHDFFMACPTVHLLDENDQFCGGTCTPGDGMCRLPTPWLADVPPLKHRWVNTWRDRARRVFENVDAFVTTNETARKVYANAYPELGDAWFEVIEHGRDIDQKHLAKPPQAAKPIRILVPGNLQVHKGANFIEELRNIDEEGRLEFHLLGYVEPEFRHLGIYHGTYDRADYDSIVARIQPSYVALFSIWAETYSHTLTEAWAAGVPVLAIDIGAIGDRVRTHGGGWLLDRNDPAGAYQRIVAMGSEEYRSVTDAIDVTLQTRSVAEMAGDYDGLYRSVLRNRRTFTAPFQHETGSPILHAGLFVVGAEKHPGSVHVRTLRRFRHPDLSMYVDADLQDVDSYLAGGEKGLDLLVVQRTAVPPDRVEDFIEAASLRDQPIVLDLDDDLLHPSPEFSSEYGDSVRGLELLASAASAVTVSTANLAEVLAEYNDNVVVVPNLLDEQLWFRPLEEARTASPLRLVYIGTKTHGADLALLKPAIDEIRRRGINIEVEVVGGEQRAQGDSWYRRIDIPDSHYPEFVDWIFSIRGRWDLAVAPLVDDAFKAHKSDLKFLEYSALGLAGVYSDVPAYQRSVVDGVTGLIATNEKAAWVDQIMRLIDDAPLRKSIRAAAYDEIVSTRGLASGTGAYVRMLSETVRERRSAALR